MLELFKILNSLPEPLKSIFIIFGVVFVIYLIIKTLMSIFETVEKIVQHIKLKIYYPLVSRLVKREHKKYVTEYLRSLVTRHISDAGLGLRYDIDIEWSDEERVLLDIEKGVLLVRVPYVTNLQQIIAKLLLMVSPYAVSQYLEPVFGPKLAQLLSISIARRYASREINVLREFTKYVDEAYDRDFRELLDFIKRADDESLYEHIVLFELRKILDAHDGYIDRNKLENDVIDLIKVVGSLHTIDIPIICGYYIAIAIVRVGVLEKIMLEEWDRYVNYIRTCIRKCSKINRIYIISAGKVVREIAKKFVDYMMSNIEKIPDIREIKLINEISYKMRYYKGKPGIPGYMAIFEIE